MAILDQLRAYFTSDVRRKIYGTVLVVVPLIVNLGLISETAGGHAVAIAGAVLALGAGVLQIANFQASSLASWFVNFGRASLYALAAVAVPAAVYFGLITQDTGAVFLAQLSTFLSSLAAIAGIVFSIPTVESTTE